MDQRERANPYEEALLTALDGRQATIWTCLPGIVESYDPATMTGRIQPAVQGVKTTLNADGSTAQSLVNMPLLVDCPVVFPRGGGCSITFPIAAGDECEIRFASRCIDAWWQQGGVQAAPEFRMHDLSDGFFTVGPTSQPNVLAPIADVSDSAVVIRSDDGATYAALDPTAQTIVALAPGGATITADTTINGDLQVNGDIGCTGDIHADGTITGDSDVVSGTISLRHHEHSGVTTGLGHTGAPIP